MKIYIRSSACISPQKTLGNGDFLEEAIEYRETRLSAIEPDYSAFIDPKLIRRMSHIIKMGVAAAQQCLHNGNTTKIGAIITGTAYGCLENTVTFLTRIIELNEESLSPTAFIQSTHNTVGAQIALILKCHQYNNTFVHKGISFESALIDAVMLLKEKEADNVLVGGIDEMTDKSYVILSRLGLYKRIPDSNLSLFNNHSKGTIGGEGVAFFLLTDKPSQDNLAELIGTQTNYKLNSTEEIKQAIVTFLARYKLQIENIDTVITGKNGDLKNDKIYEELSLSCFKNATLINYKHLCGEFPTSSAFALWLAVNMIKKQRVPTVVKEREINKTFPKKVLIYNHYYNLYHSLMLVSTC